MADECPRHWAMNGSIPDAQGIGSCRPGCSRDHLTGHSCGYTTFPEDAVAGRFAGSGGPAREWPAVFRPLGDAALSRIRNRGAPRWRLAVLASSDLQCSLPRRSAMSPGDADLWLEEVTGEKPLAWVKERNAESTGRVHRSDEFQVLDRRLLEILDSDARIPMISKHGAFLLQLLCDARNRRGIWRALQGQARLGGRARPRRPGEARKGKLGLAGTGVETRVQARRSHRHAEAPMPRWFASSTPPPRRLSRVDTHCRRWKSQLGWRGPDSVFVGTDFGPGSLMTSSDSARQGVERARRWNRQHSSSRASPGT